MKRRSHFASSTGITCVQLARSLGTFVPSSQRLGAFAISPLLVYPAFPCSDYSAPSDSPLGHRLS